VYGIQFYYSDSNIRQETEQAWDGFFLRKRPGEHAKRSGGRAQNDEVHSIN